MMGQKGWLRRTALLGAAAVAFVVHGRPTSAAAQGSTDRYVVTVSDTADFAGARAALATGGAEIVAEYPEIDMLVVRPGAATAAALATAAGIGGMVPDRVSKISPPEGRVSRTDAPGLRSARFVPLAETGRAASTIKPDPAFGYKGLLWDYRRLGLPAAWSRSAGRAAIRVGVADTGVDFTHVDLKSSVVHVEDFTADDRTSACKAALGSSAPSDKQLARKFGGPVATDWNGHGSWIGGNIAAALNGTGTNGIAPKVGLVALKIAENCGYAYDSTIIGSFVWAAKHGVDIVSITFARGTGFTPDQCYSTIQGTSMATPHVSAVLALIASAKPALRGKPDRLVAFLKSHALPAHNRTRGVSATDRSKGDLGGPRCDDAYCHLGGPWISDADAYGAGIVQAVY